MTCHSVPVPVCLLYWPRPPFIPDPYKRGNTIVDPEHRITMCRGVDLSLSPREFRVYDALAKYEGKMRTRPMLSMIAFGMIADSEYWMLLRRAICRLRRKLEHADASVDIVAIRSAGYQLNLHQKH